MGAADILSIVGEDVWKNYYKFTVIRNPFDKMISLFFFIEKINNKKSRFRRIIRNIVRNGRKNEIERFRSWVRRRGEPRDRNKYLIDGKECVDYFIRYEELNEGIRHVCDVLSIPYEPSRIPHYKSGIRNKRIALEHFYDSETIAVVEKRFAWEIERFGYQPPKPQ